MSAAPSTSAAPAFDCIVALGSNLGDKAANIDQAIRLLTEQGDVRLLKRSSDYATEPWGKTDQDWFVNAAIAVATQLGPRQLLARCKEIERRMGRAVTEKWGPRIIDLDLLVYGDRAVNDPDLVLPHPHIGARAFVLAPLRDVAPDLVIDGKSVRDMYDAIDVSSVKPLD
ncbi:MAG TPA: 2-amino-4-hydroxy-6-hydroxymethyldihydropteridine diphosphokinase [Hyphomicrobium sp.]|jgi:2-amino-4-hydroxy-6-hydroxymethyldihydropteridine diphosphokinase